MPTLSSVLSFTLLGGLAACATTSTGAAMDPQGTRTGLHLDLSVRGEPATPVFPAPIEPTVPTVDRMAHSIQARFGATTMSAQLDLCVAPDGHVTKISVARGSSYEAFDHALVRDAAQWQFEKLPGPATVESCRRATVAYHTPA